MIGPQPNREMYGKTLVELGERNPRVVVLDADVAKSTNTYRFRDRFPDRFFDLGSAELNMVCMAAGLATAGLIPFASTFVIFASLRAVEGIRTSIAYPRLNVKIVATNAGVEICGDGVTHQGVEDLAVTRAIANMVVLAPSDPVMTRKATLAIADYDGPVYMRLGRQVAQVLYDESAEFVLGKMIRLREGEDVALIACGNMVAQALRAADELARLGIQARVLDCPTIKPIDREEILAAAREAFLNQDAASKNFLRTCAQQAASTTFDPPTPWWAACPSVCKIPSNPARNRRGPSRLRPRRKSNTPPR